jgi:hypothetical protein
MLLRCVGNPVGSMYFDRLPETQAEVARPAY